MPGVGSRTFVGCVIRGCCYIWDGVSRCGLGVILFGPDLYFCF